jgi:hypothetical protein
MYGGKPGQLDAGINIAHELGHLQYRWSSGLEHFFDTRNSKALILENKVRKLRDPNAPPRINHDPSPYIPH